MSIKFTKSAHWVLQGKGGVGKSLMSSLMAMVYKNQTGHYPLCLDTDPVNTTFAGFKDFKAQIITILEEGEIVERNFDTILENIVSDESGKDFIIDNGASSFIALLSYLISNEVFELLIENGIRPVIHTVIAGGQSTLDTLGGLKSLLLQVNPSVDIYVWLNPFHGEINHNGIEFGDMLIYKEFSHRFTGVVNLPKLKEATHGHDFSMMLEDRLTFNEAFKSKDPKYNIMTKQRLKQSQKIIFDEILNTGMFSLKQAPVSK